MLDQVFSELEEKMNKTIMSLKKDFGTIRTGRASASMLDRIEVEMYGTMTPIKQAANVTTPDARTVMIKPFDKSLMGAIERAIQKSDLNINPMNDGQSIRLNIQPLTTDRRKEITKTVKKVGEEAKVALRNERRHAVDQVKKLEKDAKISEDESKKGQDKVQKVTDKFVVEIDKLSEAKEKEIMEI